jgi:hypothetical protein
MGVSDAKKYPGVAAAAASVVPKAQGVAQLSLPQLRTQLPLEAKISQSGPQSPQVGVELYNNSL